jgi:hypothetical protein
MTLIQLAVHNIGHCNNIFCLQTSHIYIHSEREVIGFFSIELILLAALWPGFDSASNRSEYQEVKQGRRISLSTSPPSVSRQSKKYGILDVYQRNRPPRLVTGIASLSF